MYAGEYVAVEMLESVYGKCPLTQQLWVYGNRWALLSSALRPQPLPSSVLPLDLSNAKISLSSTRLHAAQRDHACHRRPSRPSAWALGCAALLGVLCC